MHSKTGYISGGNARLYYETAGDGPPLVFIHAGVADSRQWENEFAAFAEDFRVMRYDQRGFGKSPPVEGEFSHMGDLVALLDALEFNQPLILIACSMGGRLAMDYALDHPSRVRALVMVGSGPSGLILDVAEDPREAEAAEALQAGDLDRAAELETQIWFDGMGRTAEQVDQEKRQLAFEMSRLALTHEAKGLGKRVPDAGTPAAERLDELDAPVLVIVGEHDDPYSHAAADHMVEHIPTARKVVLEDAAHLANMDHPDRFQRAVRSFLDELAV